MDALAWLSGFGGKVYDDLHDGGLDEAHPLLRVLETHQVLTLTLISYRDLVFSVFFYIANLLNWSTNPTAWTGGHEASLLLLYPILIGLSLGHSTSVTRYDVFFMIVFAAGMLLEPVWIVEDVSYRKWAMRAYLTWLYTVVLLVTGHRFGPAMRKVLLYAAGYFFASSLYQMLTLSELIRA